MQTDYGSLRPYHAIALAALLLVPFTSGAADGQAGFHSPQGAAQVDAVGRLTAGQVSGEQLYRSRKRVAQSGALTVHIGPDGPALLTYNGQFLLPEPDDGAVRVSTKPMLLHPGGSRAAAPGDASIPTGTEAHGLTITQRYSWGSVECAYAVHANEIRLGLTIRSTTRFTVTGLAFSVLKPRFPETPRCTELDAGQFGLGGKPRPLGAGAITADPRAEPPLLFLEYGGAALAYCGDDPATPAAVSISAALDPPANTRYALLLTPGDIAPGATISRTVLLKFAQAGATVRSLAGDVIARYAAAFPFQLRWSDRRPIGELFLSTNGRPHPAGNPRGWFNNASDVDVTTPQGLARFQQKLLRYADDSVRILKGMNAQGMITWDPEGQEFAAATYYGDPRLAGRLAPETNYKGSATMGCLDAFFAKFRDAGLRVGLCVRPQEIRFAAGVPRQTDSPDPVATLKRKIAYARNRWGCTLFYVDSTVKNEKALDADVFRKVAAAFPDVLLMPENETLRYYAYSAPLNSFQHHTVVSTPPGARMVYPEAFSVLLAGEGDVNGHRAELVAAVRYGDILLFHGWWPNPNNAIIKSIYEEAHAAPQAPSPISSRPR